MSIRFGQLIQNTTYVRPPLERGSLRKGAMTMQAPNSYNQGPAMVYADQVLVDCPEDWWGDSSTSKDSFKASFVTKVGSRIPEEVSVWLRRNPSNPDHIAGTLFLPTVLQGSKDQISFTVSLQRQIQEDPKAFRKLKPGERIMIQDTLTLRSRVDAAPQAAFEQIPASRTRRKEF